MSNVHKVLHLPKLKNNKPNLYLFEIYTSIPKGRVNRKIAKLLFSEKERSKNCAC